MCGLLLRGPQGGVWVSSGTLRAMPACPAANHQPGPFIPSCVVLSKPGWGQGSGPGQQGARAGSGPWQGWGVYMAPWPWAALRQVPETWSLKPELEAEPPVGSTWLR